MSKVEFRAIEVDKPVQVVHDLSSSLHAELVAYAKS